MMWMMCVEEGSEWENDLESAKSLGDQGAGTGDGRGGGRRYLARWQKRPNIPDTITSRSLQLNYFDAVQW